MKKIISLVVALIVIMASGGCAAPARESQILKVGVLPDVDSIPLIIAEAQGYFEKAGAKVEIEHFSSAKDRDSALQAGSIDGAISDILAAAFAKDGGFDVKITSKSDGSYKFLAGKESGIESLEEMKGKANALSKNTIIEYATDMMLLESGVKPDDIDKQVIPQIPARLEMLQNGKVDTATLPEPLASSALKNGAKLLGSTDALGINPGVILFTSKAIDSKSEEIKSFYKAYNMAVEYLNKEDKSVYIDTIIEKAGFPVDVRDIITLPQYKKAVLSDKDDFENVIKWLKDKELIKNEYKFEDLTTDAFVR